MRGLCYEWLVRHARAIAGVLAFAAGLSDASAVTKPDALASCITQLDNNPQVAQYCGGIGQGVPECRDNPNPVTRGGYFQARCGAYNQLTPHYYDPCAAGMKDHSRTNSLLQGDLSSMSACKEGCVYKPTGTCTDPGVSFTNSEPGSPTLSGVVCGWLSSGEACQPVSPEPGDDEKCMSEGGTKICASDEDEDDDPEYCISAGSGETFCVKGDDSDPPCQSGESSALCSDPNPPPDPPIEHQPPWNPNPPPPDVDITIEGNDYYYYNNNNGGGDPPPNNPPPVSLCGTAGNPPCQSPSTCGQPGRPPCETEGNGPPGNGCGREGEPVCDGEGQAACGRPGTPACNQNGTPSCGVIGTPLCGEDGGPVCGIIGRPQCVGIPGGGSGGGPGYGGPVCGAAGLPACVGGNLGGCGSVGQPPCGGCGGVGQAPCGSCGAVGQPACGNGNCGGEGQPECEGGGSASGGGYCGTPPACAGDAVNCAVLYQTYMTRCAVEDYNNYSDRPDDFGPDRLVTEGVEPEGDGIDVTASLNSSGWLGSGSCDVPTSVTVFGDTYALDEEGRLCTLFGIASVLVLVFAYYQAARIVAGGVS